MRPWTQDEWDHPNRVHTLEGCEMTLEAVIARSIEYGASTQSVVALYDALKIVRNMRDVLTAKAKRG